MATLKAREGTNLTANRAAAPIQRTSSFNGRQLSAPPSPPQRTSSFNGRRSSAPSSPQGLISSFNGRRSSAPSSPQRTSSFNARRSSAPPSPQRTSSINARRSSAPPSPQRTSSINGQRSPRPSTPENPLPPVGQDKPTHNYLKARPATPVNATKSAKILQPTSTASTKHLPVRKAATEKPPSPSSGPSRPLSSPNLLKEGSVRLPYAAPRQFTSLKSSLEKVPKIPSGAKTAQLDRTGSLGSAREASAAAAATSIPRIIGSSIPVPKFAGGKKPGQHSRTMSLGSTAIETQMAVDDINEELVIGMQTEQEKGHIAAPKLDEGQGTADSTLILDRRHKEPLELNDDVEEVIDGSMQLQEEEEEEEEEEQAEEVGTENGVMVCEEEEDSKIDEAEDTFDSKSTDGAENEATLMEQASEEAKPAKFDGSRRTVATKKEAPSHNDVIEETKSKLLEKKKNRVLALVGAFETVMALQEPDGQPDRD